ncbi:unnamed protein product [Hymenolepis diminuta]|uniref:MOR2-PAG1_N domain-containing protein n=1 Tax=Hymenolepis diminuta TaxID=6216 RepID=A0A0R3SZ08_HYMDI|nr:unnamed protein product [Hymenolepis diminuta]
MIGSNPGELVVHSLLKQFASIYQSMVENALDEKVNNNLLKCLRLSEDTAFQQLLTALYSCAEHALPCLLQTITKWYDTQHSSGSHYPFRRTSSKAGVRSQTLSVATGQAVSNPAFGGRELLIRSMLVESSTTTMGALTTVLKQLSYHPGHDDIIKKILDHAFRHFEYKENLQSKLNAENINTVADAYAKVVGELSQTR